MPVVLDVGVELALVLAFLVALGFLYLYRGTLKPFLLLFADVLDRARIPWIHGSKHVFGAVSSWIRYVANEIDRAIGLAVQATEGGVVWLWHQLAKQVTWLGRTLGGFAESVEFRFRALEASFPPAAALWLAARVAHALPAIRQSVARVENVVTARAHAEIVRLSAYAHAEGVAWRRGIADIRGLTAKQARRLSRVEARLGQGALTAAVALAIARLGGSWIRCPSLASIAKKHGCAPWRMLEDALGGVFVALAASDLCRWTSLMMGAAEQARPLFLELVDVENALIGCHGNTAPKPLRARGYSPTPVVAPVSLTG